MWTLQDAKNQFSAVVEAALAGEPQHVTRRGKPAVVVVDEAEFARLKALDEDAAAREEGEAFKRHLLNFPGYAMPEIERPVVRPRDIDW